MKSRAFIVYKICLPIENYEEVEEKFKKKYPYLPKNINYMGALVSILGRLI